MQNGPLTGLRVVEVTQGATGAFCAMQLADLGADVVKVEALEGDKTRGIGPPSCDGPSELFLWLNRNKRSAALDVTTEKGQEILRRLATRADIFLEDLGPDRAEQFALDYETLAGLNRQLVYAAISPYGEKGPLKNRRDAELVVQAMADYTGSLGSIDAPPVRVGADVATVNTAIFAFQAIMAALLQRARTREGQRVSVSMLGSLLHMRGVMWTAMSNPDDWFGFYCDTYTRAPDYSYQTKDHPILFSLGKGTSEDFDQLLIELDMLDVLDDPRFAGSGRETVNVGRYGPEVRDRWEKAFADKTADELMEIFRRRGGNAALVCDYELLDTDPQVRELGIITEVPLGEEGASIRAVGSPWTFSKTPGRSAHSTPPLLGQHTDEVLAEVGYRPDEIAQLVHDGQVITNGGSGPSR